MSKDQITALQNASRGYKVVQKAFKGLSDQDDRFSNQTTIILSASRARCGLSCTVLKLTVGDLWCQITTEI